MMTAEKRKCTLADIQWQHRPKGVIHFCVAHNILILNQITDRTTGDKRAPK